MTAPKLLRQWVGLRCKLRREIRTGHQIAPAGMLVTVGSTTVGRLHCTSEPCAHCGVRFFVRMLMPCDLEPIERVSPEDPPRKRGWP